MPRTFEDDQLLNRAEAADFLNKKPNTLAVWATKKRYNIPYTYSGGEAQYWKSDLIAHLNSRLISEPKK